MTKETNNTEKQVVMTKEQIATKYYEHNLDMCKEHMNEELANYKKEQMACIVDVVEQIFNLYVRKIQNIKNDEVITQIYNVEKIYKLELIEKIIKF